MGRVKAFASVTTIGQDITGSPVAGWSIRPQAGHDEHAAVGGADEVRLPCHRAPFAIRNNLTPE